MSRQLVKKWIELGCPGKPGVYNLIAIEEWRIARLKKQGGTVQRWKRRLERAKARIAENELSKRHGRLVDPTALVRDFEECLQTIKAEMQRAETMGEACCDRWAERFSATWRTSWNKALTVIGAMKGRVA